MDKLALVGPVRSRPAEGGATATLGRPASNGVGKKKITKDILQRHINVLPGIDIFGHLNKIRASRDVGQKLAFLEDLLSRNNDPTMIFNMASASFYLDKKQKIKMADYDVAVKSGKLEYEEVLLDLMLE